MEISIRTMTPDDASHVNSLSKQLGYHLSLQQTLQNITEVTQSKDHTAFVAICENKIAGWIGVPYMTMIEVMPHCEINRLVIDESYRGKEVGKLLIESANNVLRKKGLISSACRAISKERMLIYFTNILALRRSNNKNTRCVKFKNNKPSLPKQTTREGRVFENRTLLHFTCYKNKC